MKLCWFHARERFERHSFFTTQNLLFLPQAAAAKSMASSFCMKNIRISISLLGCIALIVSGCANSKSPSVHLEKQLIGNWEAVATQLTFTTEGREAGSRTINVSEGEWESRMSRTAPQMSYLADHRYTSMYVSLVDFEGRPARDTVAQKGTWALRGDTLVISEPNLSLTETRFKVKIDQDRLELSSTMDMDADGQVDDTYWMMQKRRK
jgi:uncharacterized lipoprotein NlpE involved in copper resistance